jgi:hypothetical protein
VVTDRDESFDVAAENPQVVAQMLAEMEKLMAGFPDDVRKAYAEVKDRTASTRPAGAVTQ